MILGRTTQPKEVTIAGTKRRIQTTPTPTTTTTQVPEIEEEEVVEEEETTTTRRWPTTTTSGYTKKRFVNLKKLELTVSIITAIHSFELFIKYMLSKKGKLF